MTTKTKTPAEIAASLTNRQADNLVHVYACGYTTRPLSGALAGLGLTKFNGAMWTITDLGSAVAETEECQDLATAYACWAE